MDVLGVLWTYEVGEFVVYEIEHLFGVDVVLARAYGERLLPVGIVTNPEPMSEYHRKFARMWAIASAGGDYGAASNALECCSTRWPTS